MLPAGLRSGGSFIQERQDITIILGLCLSYLVVLILFAVLFNTNEDDVL